MRKIIKISFVEKRFDKDGEPYFRTHAILDDGDEVVGWSEDRDEFQVDDEVERFYHRETAKMRKP